ncbi:MAG TPA: hypothetical protein PLO61_00365 [Fimbriimonadaceae bacterium]|nr:hypothetical protein [Fimbriimonadaceae bacterium]HRJ32350.1 hypothetical protein [Fimbriimonadaceae bacterium]
MEVLARPDGQPEVRYDFRGVQVWVSLTHTDSLAMAFVVAERA